jgi:hypothetical protein
MKKLEIDSIGWRKFSVAMTSIILSFVALSQGWIDSGSWTAIVGLVVGLYGAANVGSVIANR